MYLYMSKAQKFKSQKLGPIFSKIKKSSILFVWQFNLQGPKSISINKAQKHKSQKMGPNFFKIKKKLKIFIFSKSKSQLLFLYSQRCHWYEAPAQVSPQVPIASRVACDFQINYHNYNNNF